jgi:hypothetical protein
MKVMNIGTYKPKISMRDIFMKCWINNPPLSHKFSVNFLEVNDDFVPSRVQSFIIDDILRNEIYPN